MNDSEIKKLALKIKEWRASPIVFVKDIWGLIPQPLKLEYKDREINDEVDAIWFEEFEKGSHITWHQWLLLLAVEKAIKGQSPKWISCRSGHGCGKTAVLSWLLIWFLLCFEDSQVPCTAPTSDQIYDVLWKEVAIWIRKMPQPYQDLLEWSTSYVRMKFKPESWFARARTARKENPEALAGIHANHVLFLVDEASGVPDEIYQTAEGSLTGLNTLVILISNPTRLIGYFYDTHHRNKNKWQSLHFNSEESPIVENNYCQRMAEEHGIMSDEYAIRVRGDFPKEDAIDDKGFVPLLLESDLRFIETGKFLNEIKMGVDPSGEGDDETVWAVRDRFIGKIAAKENISTEKSIAQKTLTLASYFDIQDKNITVDNFGQGANVAKEIALSSQKNVNSINVGDLPSDTNLYRNIRAEAYFRLRTWVRSGGELVSYKGLKEQLLSIRYRRNLAGKIEIMSKREMRKMGYGSPDMADAFMLTFVRAEPVLTDSSQISIIHSKISQKGYLRK